MRIQKLVRGGDARNINMASSRRTRPPTADYYDDDDDDDSNNNNNFDQLSSLGSESLVDDLSSVGYDSYQAHQRNLHHTAGDGNNNSRSSLLSCQRRSSLEGANNDTRISGLTEENSTAVAYSPRRSGHVGAASSILTNGVGVGVGAGVSGLYEKSAEVSATHEHVILLPEDDDDDDDDHDDGNNNEDDHASPSRSIRNDFSESGGGGGGGGSNNIMSAIAPRTSEHFSARSSQRRNKSKKQLLHHHQAESFTRNRLRIQEIGFYGREAQTNRWKSLLEAHHQQQSPKPTPELGEEPNNSNNNSNITKRRRQLVLLSGPSGSGKSRLLQEWTKHNKNSGHNKLLCLGGKFDQSHHNLPYSAIALACEKFLATLFVIHAASNIPKAEDHPPHPDSHYHDSTRHHTMAEEARHMRISNMVLPSSRNHNTKNNNTNDDNDNTQRGKEEEESSSASSAGTGSHHRHHLDISYQQICGRLQEVLDREESKLLVQFIPTLYGMLKKIDSGSNDDDAYDDDDAEHNNTMMTSLGDTDLFSKKSLQFQHAFKKFLRTLADVASNSSSSLVLILDDLQWSDAPSLELLKAIVTDHENTSGLIVIGCFRSEEVDEEWIRDLQDTQSYGADSVTNLVIDNLSVENVHAMIADMMSEDMSERTRALAELSHTKTLGNPLFAIQYMKLLVDVALLTFEVGRFEWNWDIQRIDGATMATKNVVDVMLRKMMQLPNAITRCVRII
jgi:Cdc6-like AAA superfamily ATPase